MKKQACKTNYEGATEFGSIENAQEYLSLLAQVIQDSREAVEPDLCAEDGCSQDARRLRALRIIIYNLEKLGYHVKTSRRILNDLRTLRRLLQQQTVNELPPA